MREDANINEEIKPEITQLIVEDVKKNTMDQLNEIPTPENSQIHQDLTYREDMEILKESFRDSCAETKRILITLASLFTIVGILTILVFPVAPISEKYGQIGLLYLIVPISIILLGFFVLIFVVVYLFNLEDLKNSNNNSEDRSTNSSVHGQLELQTNSINSKRFSICRVIGTSFLIFGGFILTTMTMLTIVGLFLGEVFLCIYLSQLGYWWISLLIILSTIVAVGLIIFSSKTIIDYYSLRYRRIRELRREV